MASVMQAGGGAPSALWRAAASGDTLLLDRLLVARPASADIDLRVHGHTALMTAAQNGHDGAVRLLCDAEGVDLRAATEMGRSAIHLAAEAGHDEVVAFLAELSPAPATKNADAAVGTQNERAPPPPEAVEPECAAEDGPEDDELTRALSILPEPYARTCEPTLTHTRAVGSLTVCAAGITGDAVQCARRWRQCSLPHEQ